MRSFEHMEWAPEGEDFELRDCSRANIISKRHQEQDPNGHRWEGYSSPAVTAMISTRTNFLVGTKAAVLDWSNRNRERFARYLRTRHAYYSLERRWPDSVFWRRRQ